MSERIPTETRRAAIERGVWKILDELSEAGLGGAFIGDVVDYILAYKPKKGKTRKGK